MRGREGAERKWREVDFLPPPGAHEHRNIVLQSNRESLCCVMLCPLRRVARYYKKSAAKQVCSAGIMYTETCRPIFGI